MDRLQLFPGLEVCSLLRELEGFRGVFVCLLRKFMRGQMVALPVGSSCGLMSMSGLIVILGSAVVRTLWHSVSPVSIEMQRSNELS
jgi:hypothetical protein